MEPNSEAAPRDRALQQQNVRTLLQKHVSAPSCEDAPDESLLVEPEVTMIHTRA